MATLALTMPSPMSTRTGRTSPLGSTTSEGTRTTCLLGMHEGAMTMAARRPTATVA